MRRTEAERAEINYLNSRTHWQEMGCRGIYIKDHNWLVGRLRALRQAAVQLGIDPAWFANMLGPQCLLEMESDNNPYHTTSDYQRWLEKRECDKVEEAA